MGDAAHTLRQGRDAYLEANHLPPDGGYQDRWVKLRVGPLPFAFPNTRSRRADVPFHDLHHVLTGYGTDLIGEAEIGAWEIGSHCRSRAARQLNLRVIGFLWPLRWRPIWTAFLRGRRCRNLYGGEYDDALLERSVSEVRAELGLSTEQAPPSRADRLAFAGWSAAAVGLVWGPLLPLGLLGWYLLR